MTDDPVPIHEGGQVEPSSSLLIRVRARDQTAWQRLVGLYAPVVFGWCRRCGLQAADAADVGQEVFEAVAGALDEFRRDRPGDSFRAWVRAITRTKIIDHARQQRNAAIGQGGDQALNNLARVEDERSNSLDASGPQDEAEEKRQVCQQALDLIQVDFEERTWKAFLRFVVDEQPAAAVAAEFGMTANAVYLVRTRVLRRLRDELAGLEEI